MSSLQSELSQMLAGGWRQLNEWNGIVPGHEFYAVVGGYHRSVVLQRFICGAIVHKEPSHGKIVDGQWIPVGNDRIWILRVTESGQLHGGMTGCSSLHASKEKALTAVDEMISQAILRLRNDAEKLVAQAAALEAGTPEIEILDFAVDSDEIPQ